MFSHSPAMSTSSGSPLSGPVAAAFKVRALNQKEIFTDPSIVKVFEDALMTEASRFGCDPLVYVFMPDHCHVILRGKNREAQPSKAMEAFTEVTRHWLSQHQPEVRWPSFGPSTLLADQEDISVHLHYILDEPVRKGIVSDWKDYRFKGSAIFDLDNWWFPV
jgi:REP element-mobilizing transposase RayT